MEKTFSKLRWLDLSMNPLIGAEFEHWLKQWLIERPNLRVILYGTNMMIHPDTREWKKRFPTNVRGQIVVSCQSFSTLH